MQRIAWLTDLHLNFVEAAALTTLEAEVAASQADVILISGDIGEAHNVVRFLTYLADVFERPTHVVLGNHDFYRGGIARVRADVQELADKHPHLHFLTGMQEPVALTGKAALIGHDGWADAREGDYNRSLVMMNDYLLIEELAGYSKQDRLPELHRLGDEAAMHIRTQLQLALADFSEVFVLTHVPPFRSACWYQGQVSDDEWAPHFVCQAVGRAILDMASIYPGKEITVLCGHTHSAGVCQPAPNVKVITGAAEYGHPEVTQVFELRS